MLEIVKPRKLKKHKAPVPRCTRSDAWQVIQNPTESIATRIDALQHLPLAKQREIASWPLDRFYREKFYWEVCQRAKRYAVNFTCEGCGERLVPLWVRIRSFEHHGNEGAHLQDLEALCCRCCERADEPHRGLAVVASLR